MTELVFERHVAEIVTQTELLLSTVDGADLDLPVPSCPEWTLGRLLHHIGAGHRWAARIVRSRASAPLPDSDLREGASVGPDYAERLREGAWSFRDTLLAAGPDARVWIVDGSGGTPFWARRFCHETVVHRADATLAVGAEFEAEREVLVDTLAEWMDLIALPVHMTTDPAKKALLAPGRTLHFHATDVDGPDAEWTVDLTRGDRVHTRRGHEKAAVAVRGPVEDLVMALYGRSAPDGSRVEVHGDGDLLDLWLRTVRFR
ncbi:maleylpyruvate isomerase family mycothiol-dependent enzyme [Actinosynnema sp. NPDC020468]|uniref:maleylpyruvate isomerase family mycothiol-dependent enzyme n=1 Tax=Actinosynnema sp. NPDC020468 TaxID=3154488 RepID=UPI0033CE0A5B